MTERHIAFGIKRRLPTSKDPEPHVLTESEREYIHTQLRDGKGVRAQLIKKLVRLYDEAHIKG